MFIEEMAKELGLVHENDITLRYGKKSVSANVYLKPTYSRDLPHWVRLKLFKHSSRNAVVLPFDPSIKEVIWNKIEYGDKDVKTDDINCGAGFCVFASDELEEAHTRATKETSAVIDNMEYAYNNADDSLRKKCTKVAKGLEDYDNIKDEIEETKKKYAKY